MKKLKRKVQPSAVFGMALLKNLSSEQRDLLIRYPSSIEQEKAQNDLAARLLGFKDIGSCDIEGFQFNYSLMVLCLPVDSASKTNDCLKALGEAYEILCKHFNVT